MSKRSYGTVPSSVFVTDTTDGATFEVLGEGVRPSGPDRNALATAVCGVSDSLFTVCEATGVTLAASPLAKTVTLPDGTKARLASVAADRAVNDDPSGRFVVTDRYGNESRVGYSLATVVGIDPTLNGSQVRTLHLDAILNAARRRLDEWGKRLDD